MNRPASEAALEALVRDARRSKALLAATDAIVWTIHPDDGFVEPQPSWQAYTGQRWEEARGSGWIEAVHPEDRQMVLLAWTQASRQDERYAVTCRIWHAGSRQHRTCVVRASAIRDGTGKVLEWVGAVTDVHDRPLSLPEMHRLNDALRHQLEAHHQELQRLFSVSLDVMLTMSVDGRLITLSPSFETVTGRPVREAVGELFERFVHPEDLVKTWAEVRRVLTGEHNAIDFETRVMRADGTVRIVSWRAVGSVAEARLYAVGRDVTEQREAQQRVLRAQKMEAIGQLTGGITHDFNNILAAVTSYIEVARRLGAQDPARLDDVLASALGATRRGAALVSQLLTFARREQLAQEPVDINVLVAEMAEMIQRTLGGAIALEVDLQAGSAVALANRAQLESVLLNLCINSRDAMPHGGTLIIGTSRHAITDDPATRIDDLPQGDYVLMSVDDTGTGMDDATLARCLEPFFSTKGPGRGTGLGLPQAVSAVQQLGGNLRIHSRPGAGTKVEIALPLAGAARGGAARAGAAPMPPSLERKTILLVDDDAQVLASTTQLLQGAGYEVIPAASAEDAMAIVLTSRPFDVLVTDYALPRMNGAELVENVRRLRPKLVAVLTAGAGNLEQLQRELAQIPILPKPYASDRLFKALEASVATHRLRTGEQ